MRHVEREILSALVDGELTPDERRFVHEHLQQCTDCREAADEFAHLHGLVGELPKLVAPESFVSDALKPRPRSAVASVTTGKRRWVLVGAAAAGIAVTLAGLAAPPPAAEPPVDRFIARHVSVHAGVEAGGQVLFAVNGR